MYRRNNKELFNPKGLMIYDPSLTHDVIQQQIPAVPFVEYFAPLLALNSSTMADLRQRHESCGYADYLQKNLVFPPPGQLPEPPQLQTESDCDVWSKILE
jgi:carboxypeptidase D